MAELGEDHRKEVHDYCGVSIPDAEVLRAAARVYKRRSTKSDAFWTRVIVRLLLLSAEKVEEEDAAVREPPPS